jgi:hypothetical protein
MRTPVTVIENKAVAAPTPVARGHSRPTSGARTQVPGTQ